MLVGKGGAIAFEGCVTGHDIKCDESSAFAHGVLGKHGSMGLWECFSCSLCSIWEMAWVNGLVKGGMYASFMYRWTN